MSSPIVKDEVVFKDGHREDIIYIERWSETRTYFRTEKSEFIHEYDETTEVDKFSEYCLAINQYVPCDAIDYISLPSTLPREVPCIKDSGNRRQFETGAVRDIQEGKGRCDLMPLDVIAIINGCGEDSHILGCLGQFQKGGMIIHLCGALEIFTELYFKNQMPTMFLEVSKHFEEGAKKYGENNWQKGIPVRCYIDSAVRHYLKHLRGDTDEPHDRAFCWNIMCAIWTCINKPELNDYKTGSDEHV